MSILDLLKSNKRPSPARPDGGETRTVREIVDALDRMPAERARFAAAFAYLLGRVAYADLDISRVESERMEKLIEQVGGLQGEQALIVVQMAKTHARLFGGTENYLVAREFDQIASGKQKRDLLRCLFAVAAADDELSTAEDNEIRQIADELKIDRREVAALRAEHKDILASLKQD
jgi:uncharacterized tellurite resistance protein B-like protein